jgi:rare lipoprotein A
MTSLTAAHPSLPFGTLLRVTNLRNGREVVVRVNNRGPFHRNRIIDLSKEAARQLGMVGSGLAKVQVEVLQAVEPIGNWGQQAMRKLAGQ